LQAPAAQAALQRIVAHARAAGGSLLLLTASKQLNRSQLPVLQETLQQLVA
jgi:hypothetical protein